MGESRTASRRLRWLAVLFLGLVIATVALGVALERLSAAPRLLGMYLERRASGHAPWISSTGRWLNALLVRLDRGETPVHVAFPQWSGAGKTAGAEPGFAPTLAATTEDLVKALAMAKPGDTIVVAPGRYRFSGRALDVDRPGTETAPIVVKGAVFGTSILEFDMLEGFLVRAPHWHFEDLVIEGACRNDADCEHAFHVVGGAHHVTIRNNLIRDFNAHIKINGSDGRFPDAGVISNNTLLNRTARRTDSPVTPIDLVAANGWRIESNLIADFVKAEGDTTSYGAFVKGAGRSNQFLRNVVLCEWRLRNAPGRRIGLSFGGGGSDARGCRDRRCVTEHDDGLMAANLIASCSDAGIYVNRSPVSKIIQNTVVDTAGIEVRFAESSAQLTGNLVDGIVRVRDQGVLIDDGTNQTTPAWVLYLGNHPVRDLFADAAALDMRLTGEPHRMESAEPRPDLCVAGTTVRAYVGAFDDFGACLSGAAVSRRPARPRGPVRP